MRRIARTGALVRVGVLAAAASAIFGSGLIAAPIAPAAPGEAKRAPVPKVGLFDGEDGLPDAARPFLVPPKPPEPSATASHAAVPDVERAPYSTHGKLLIRLGGQDASCSATVINTPNESTIVSAAHCVRAGFGNRGYWARKVVFVPAYNRGRRPFGSFRASRIWVPREFWRYENPNFDVSIIRLRPNKHGKVAEVVGARGWATDISRQHRYTVFGYPAGAMGGEVMRTCTSRVHGIRNYSKLMPGPAPSRIVCDMAAGSSGGGWIYGRGYLNSVIGYANRGRPGILYGPYFGSEIRKLIKRVG
jgi:hypothetical protein